jgi:hypothetical protein
MFDMISLRAKGRSYINSGSASWPDNATSSGTTLERLAGDRGVGDLGVAFPLPLVDEGIGLVPVGVDIGDLGFGGARRLFLDVEAIGLPVEDKSCSADLGSGSPVGVPVKAL